MEISPPRYSNNIVDDEDCPKFFGCGSEYRTTTNGQFIIEWEPIEYITDMEMNICFISEIHTVTVPPFMSPEIIRDIHFDSFISHTNFVTLLTPLINLKLLEIHLSSLEYLNFSNNETSPPVHFMDLPNLECLEISSANFSYYHALHSDMETILQNISAILTTTQNNFPRLIYLSISVPIFPPMDEDFAHSILKCIIKHKLTLKYLNIEAEYTLLHDCNENLIFDESFYNENKKDLSKSLLKSTEGVNLSSFHFFSLVRTASTEIWKQFIQSQENLEYLQFWCEEYYYNFPQDLLERNDSLIHTITLNINVENKSLPMLPINLQIFHECPYLKNIYLKGNSKVVSSICAEKSSDIKNADMLPETLEFIKLINLHVDKDDAHFIATGLPKLKKLYLKDIGEEGNFGLSISDLNILLQKNGIQKVEIISSINRNSLSEKTSVTPGNMSMGGFEIISKILFSKQMKTSFRVMANFEGGFDPIISDDEDDDDDDDDEELDEDDGVEEMDLEEETVKVEQEEPSTSSVLEVVVPTRSRSTTSGIDINENNLVDDSTQSTSIVIPENILSVATKKENILGADSHLYKEVDFKQNNLEQEENEQSVTSSVDPCISTTSQNKINIIPTISQMMINPDRSSDASTSHASTIEVHPRIELVDEDEANLDIFVKDFSTDHEPPS